eukprot:48008-Amphidinium_carterae.1
MCTFTCVSNESRLNKQHYCNMLLRHIRHSEISTQSSHELPERSGCDSIISATHPVGLNLGTETACQHLLRGINTR